MLGSRGILPAGDFLRAVARELGTARFWYVPTFCWFNSTDAMLHALCAAGALASALAIAGVFSGPLLLASWAIYLSLASVGQDFLSFQWDILLLEAGLLSAFLSPWKRSDALRSREAPSPLALFLPRWLLFRLMFESGCAKLLSGDPTWRQLTALEYHYETQCLPTWLGWYAHQLPGVAQRASAGAMFVIELVLPFFIFAPRTARLIAFFGLAALQALIAATGNYGFFNLLTFGLCLLLLDDESLIGGWRLLRDRIGSLPALPDAESPKNRVPGKATFGSRLRSASAVTFAALIIGVSGAELGRMLGAPVTPLTTLAGALRPLRSINVYGLFAVMTTMRNEIVLEGSRDGQDWKPYEFKWKPGDPSRRPPFVAPHQPRLDWQMWFAVLGRYQENPWLMRTMERLLEGSPIVLALLKTNPFPESPPKFMRAVVYEYHFTSLSERRASGAWWRRELRGLYAPAIARQSPAR